MTFASPSETESELSPSHAALPCLARVEPHPKTLSVRAHQARAPLLGFSKDSPPSRYWPRVHSQTVARPSARGCQPRACSVLAVPPGFDGLLRASPAGLLHPAPDHGVRSVSGSFVDTTLRQHHRSQPSPRPRFTPFRAFPSTTAVPRHRGPCPLIVRAPHE